MSSPRPPVQLLPLQTPWLDEVLAIEQRAHPHPWTAQHFLDAVQAGNQVRVLLDHQQVLGYWVGMPGVDEVHLLNITVDPTHQGQGWAHAMLADMVQWARNVGAQWVWLEVRVGNAPAIKVYKQAGFQTVGQRKNYYPAANGLREDALVMNLAL